MWVEDMDSIVVGLPDRTELPAQVIGKDKPQRHRLAQGKNR
jgi:S1-C subfamily serine protease